MREKTYKGGGALRRPFVGASLKSLQVKSLSKKRHSLHTCSNEKRFFEIKLKKKRLWLEHVCRIRSRFALLLRFYSVFCVGADFGSLELFGRIFLVFRPDLPIAEVRRYLEIVIRDIRDTHWMIRY